MKKIALYKTITWYFFHFIMVSTLGTVITGKTDVGVKIASAELLFETVLFYTHEKLWQRLKEKLK